MKTVLAWIGVIALTGCATGEQLPAAAPIDAECVALKSTYQATGLLELVEPVCRNLVSLDGSPVTDPAIHEAIRAWRGDKGILRVAPNYPTRLEAIRGSGLMACVIVGFDIDEQGRTENVRILESRAKQI